MNKSKIQSLKDTVAYLSATLRIMQDENEDLRERVTILEEKVADLQSKYYWLGR